MSCMLQMETPIKDAGLLATACNRMRSAGINVTGPEHKVDAPHLFGRKVTGYFVRLPDWNQSIVFSCNDDASVKYDTELGGPIRDAMKAQGMTVEQLSAQSGVPVALLKEVLSYSMDDSLSGDQQRAVADCLGISVDKFFPSNPKNFYRLGVEYRTAAVMREATNLGGYVSNYKLDEDACRVHMRIEIPELV